MEFLIFLAIVVAALYLLRDHIGIWYRFFPNAMGSGNSRSGNQQTTPVSHLRGEAFEHYLQDKTFSASDFKLVYRTPSYQDTVANYDANALNPDFRFYCTRKRKDFWVEAKFRESLVDGKVEWCRWDQLQRYRRVNSQEPVFVAIGFGGWPARPKRLFIVPLDALQYTGVYLSVLEPFEIHPERPIWSQGLWMLAATR